MYMNGLLGAERLTRRLPCLVTIGSTRKLKVCLKEASLAQWKVEFTIGMMQVGALSHCMGILGIAATLSCGVFSD
jgi:hypothetical protein